MTTTTINELSLNLSRFIKAPRERIFDAWIKPEQLTRWFGPGSCRVLEAQIDARPGGSYRFRMRPEEKDIFVGGTYREVVPPSKLVFTWGWEDPEMSPHDSLVTVLFEETGGGTHITITHTGFTTEEERNEHEFGWTGCLDKLERQAQAAAECHQPGHFSWNELAADDPEKAAAFYTGLFGWEAVPMAGGMPYTLFKKDGVDVAGLLKTKQEGSQAYWVAYVTVTDADASALSAAQLGAKVMVPPFDIPNVGRIFLVQDPQGAMLGLFQPKS